jgi:hypothetical protein
MRTRSPWRGIGEEDGIREASVRAALQFVTLVDAVEI